jgi:hypothetical protein
MPGAQRAGSGCRRWPRTGPTAAPSRCWCSSPPTTSTRCRPSRRRRSTTWSSPCSANAWPPACSGCRRGWRRARRTRGGDLQQALAQLRSLLGHAAAPAAAAAGGHPGPGRQPGAPGAGGPGAVLRGRRQVRARGDRRARAPDPPVAARAAAAAGPGRVLAGAPRHGGAGACHRHRPARGVGQGHADAGRAGPRRWWPAGSTRTCSRACSVQPASIVRRTSVQPASNQADREVVDTNQGKRTSSRQQASEDHANRGWIRTSGFDPP